MKKYFCVKCGYIYDEIAGDPERGIARCMLVSMLPDSWACPDCGASAESLCARKVCNYETLKADSMNE